jgi:spermidine/putrescine transport system substrate-binding protein
MVPAGWADTGYNNAIEGSDQFMDKALSADTAVAIPAAYANRLRDIKNCSQAARDLNDKVWTRLKK